jgi:tetratricopeptide (TPR) repeat protein
MAKSFQESYIDVERAYSQGQFKEALTQAEALLNNRPEDADDLQFSRLQLLSGHINLYGLKQYDAASTYYDQVVETSQEPTYRDLARQGLDICASERAKPAPVASDPPFETEASGTLAAGATAPAMPWLTGDQAPGTASGPQDFADPFKTPTDLSTASEPDLVETAEEVLSPADDGIIEAKVVVEDPIPRSSEAPATQPSSFSAEELAQLAKGRLRVILR